MRVYVAGKFEEKLRIREVMDAVRAAGHVVTYDWTYDTEMREETARRDFEGVSDANAVVLVLEKAIAYKGAWTEFGMALAWGIPVYVVGAYGENRDVNIFLYMPGVSLGAEALFAALGVRV